MCFTLTYFGLLTVICLAVMSYISIKFVVSYHLLVKSILVISVILSQVMRYYLSRHVFSSAVFGLLLASLFKVVK